MNYIVCRRFKGKALCGYINLSAMTECECIKGVITHKGKPICYAASENAHQFFATNEDGMGMERGRLTQEIQKELAKLDADHQKRWDKVWDDPVCHKYKREDHEDHWLWNQAFFGAGIDDLRHIARLVGATKGGKV